MDHKQLLDSREKCRSFLFIQLNPGIKPVNMCGYLLMVFVTFAALGICMGFISFILTDQKYYNVD